MKKREWEIIAECNDPVTDEPRQWACEVNHKKYGKFVWIYQESETEFHIEVMPDHGDVNVLKVCKSLTSAKRWVSMNI